MSKDKPAVAPILSLHISSYKLTKPQKALFRKFDEVIKYMASVGKKPPCVRLSRSDWSSINEKVIEQSQGARTLHDVAYGDYPILQASE